MQTAPFCVLDRPFVVWAPDIAGDCNEFLNSVDADFYERAAHMLVEAGEQTEGRTKHVSALARLLWHHGIETLVMLIGALAQAPAAPHAYVLKCRSADVVQLARGLLDQSTPPYHRLLIEEYSVSSLLRGVHARCPWEDLNQSIERFERALSAMLSRYVDPHTRWEYNSIKHGLRASHGPFLLKMGKEEVYGVQASEEDMQVVGQSEEASYFSVPRSLSDRVTNNAMNFRLDQVAVTWSLDRMACELRLIGMLVGNVVSFLKIYNGIPASQCEFRRMANGEWWTFYEEIAQAGVTNWTFGYPLREAPNELPTPEDVFEFYRSGSWNHKS